MISENNQQQFNNQQQLNNQQILELYHEDMKDLIEKLDEINIEEELKNLN